MAFLSIGIYCSYRLPCLFIISLVRLMLVTGFAASNTSLEELLNRSPFLQTQQHWSSALISSLCGSQDGIGDYGDVPAATLIMLFGEKAAVELV